MMNKEMKKFFFKPKSLEGIIGNATIVVDTNVLLSAYQWKEASFKEVLHVLKRTAEADRLRIPMHVLEEFMDQRPKLIQSALERINTDIYSKIQKPNNLSSTIPLISLLSDHDEYIALEEEYLKSYREYRKKLEDLSSKLRLFFHDDPVLDSLKTIFEDACFTSINKQDKTLDEEGNSRLAKKRPPLCGGDSGKKENKLGDFYIWKDILSIKNDVIFVSTDFKEDWYYLDQQKKPLSPRRELVEEFYEVNEGKTCCIISLANFIKISEPSTSQEVINDLIANQNFITKDENLEQTFELKYRNNTENGGEKLAYNMYSYLYFDYDIKFFAYSAPYLNSHSNRTEYIYVKIGLNQGDTKIPASILLNSLMERERSESYVLLDIKEVYNVDFMDFTYLEG